MVHLENLLCFHDRPLFDDESGSFSQTWTSPHTMLLQGGHFQRTDPTLYGGRGAGMVKLLKKVQCTMTFDQDCRWNAGFAVSAPCDVCFRYATTAVSPKTRIDARVTRFVTNERAFECTEGTYSHLSEVGMHQNEDNIQAVGRSLPFSFPLPEIAHPRILSSWTFF